jgi:endoglucanase
MLMVRTCFRLTGSFSLIKRLLATITIVALALTGVEPAQTTSIATSFPLHLGINVAGPFVEIKTGTDGRKSDFRGDNMNPGWFSGKELRTARYDFIRLPVNPTPLLENSPQARAFLLDEVERGMRPYLAAGLHVVFDLQFWSPPNRLWTPQAVIADPRSPLFAKYRSMTVEVASRLARYRHGTVALELFNEPPPENCERSWIPEQRMLLADVRSVAPELPVVVTGCQGQTDGLLSLNRSKINMDDKNLLFTFHFYEPFIFTHQSGYVEYKYLEGVSYPAASTDLRFALLKTTANIDKANLSPIDAMIAKGRATKLLSEYFAQGQGRPFIEGRFDSVVAWARANRISVSRVYLGEFAAINWRKSDTVEYHASRLQWDEDVRNAATKRGIATAYWNLPYPRGPIFR